MSVCTVRIHMYVHSTYVFAGMYVCNEILHKCGKNAQLGNETNSRDDVIASNHNTCQVH